MAPVLCIKGVMAQMKAKWAMVVVAMVIALFVMLMNFSAAESRFECLGTTRADRGLPENATVFIKLIEYRPWIVWADSDASMHFEIPNRHIEYFEHVMRAGDQMQIFSSHRDPKIRGNFSKLSHTLAIATPYGFFDGSCKEKS